MSQNNTPIHITYGFRHFQTLGKGKVEVDELLHAQWVMCNSKNQRTYNTIYNTEDKIHKNPYNHIWHIKYIRPYLLKISNGVSETLVSFATISLKPFPKHATSKDVKTCYMSSQSRSLAY